jgi:hypothetical protein
MKSLICLAVVISALSGSAMAFDFKSSLAKNNATMSGGASSSSSVMGESAFGGRTGIHT